MFPITVINLRLPKSSLKDKILFKPNKSDKPFKLQKNYQIPVDLYLLIKIYFLALFRQFARRRLQRRRRRNTSRNVNNKRSETSNPSIEGIRPRLPDKENKKGCVNYSFYYFNYAMIIDENKVMNWMYVIFGAGRREGKLS